MGHLLPRQTLGGIQDQGDGITSALEHPLASRDGLNTGIGGVRLDVLPAAPTVTVHAVSGDFEKDSPAQLGNGLTPPVLPPLLELPQPIVRGVD